MDFRGKDKDRARYSWYLLDGGVYSSLFTVHEEASERVDVQKAQDYHHNVSGELTR